MALAEVVPMNGRQNGSAPVPMDLAAEEAVLGDIADNVYAFVNEDFYKQFQANARGRCHVQQARSEAVRQCRIGPFPVTRMSDSGATPTEGARP